MSDILVVGTMAFDCIETPFGKRERIIGGSANHFAMASSFFTEVKLVSVVGEDFPSQHLAVLQERGVDTQGIEIATGRTFFWSGKYDFDLNSAKTLDTQLNVFADFKPKVPESFKKPSYLMLANLSPVLQLEVLRSIQRPKLVVADTMNFWIEGQREPLLEVIKESDIFILNEGEVRELTGEHNLVKAANWLINRGPRIVVVKRGEYGAVLFEGGRMYCAPGLPLIDVLDPTGAGDTFAGGFLGYIASTGGRLAPTDLRKAVLYGSTMASLTVQDFGTVALQGLGRADIESRYREFVDLSSIT